MDGQITLTHGIEINGQPKTALRIRHRLSMGDLAAVQRYARKHDLSGDIGELLEGGDYGAILALVEALCQLPPGTLDQLHPEDLPAVLEAAAPFLSGGSPGTGSQTSEPLP